ncbi:MAG TPA: acetyl-CoA carboxylase biotin carboxyl carrier protein subunit [Stellaceae bacterium]|nr:acetyl-CoA carboxylase biotin carboxyl carrier protein subunit [Stellaceae bacterium]
MVKGRELTVDGDLVRALAALLHETGLREIDYAEGDRRIRVVRDTPEAAGAVRIAASPAAAPAQAAPSAAAAEHPGAVKAPMVGTAYLAPQPGAPPFVTPGETVREGQVLMLIEAMKVMNQIPAPRAGRVVEILVADGAPVEYGQALLILE